MAETIYIDLKNGTVNKTLRGWEGRRPALVTGVTGDGDEQVYNAIVALQTQKNIYVGQNHSILPLCVVSNITGEMLSSGTVRLTIEYSPAERIWTGTVPSFNTLSGSATLRQVETNKDINGNRIGVTYDWKAGTRFGMNPDDVYTEETAPGPETVYKTTTRLAAELVQRWTQIESVNPLNKAANYLGKVNTGPWVFDNDEGCAEKWLIEAIEWQTADNGATWQVSYIWHFVPEGWNSQEVAFTRPHDGQIPDDATIFPGGEANPNDYGIRPVKHYLPVDFDDLGIQV